MKSGSSTKRGEKSRWEALGDTAQLPNNPAPHLTDWLFEIGPRNSEGGGIGWRDIAAWQHIVGVVLEPWEARLIRRLSGEYAVMISQGEKADCAPPYVADAPDPQQARDRVADQFRAMMTGLANAGGQR